MSWSMIVHVKTLSRHHPFLKPWFLYLSVNRGKMLLTEHGIVEDRYVGSCSDGLSIRYWEKDDE